MAANSQQFSMRHDPPPQSKKVNEVSIASLEQKFNKLTSLVQQLAVGNMHQIKACVICSNMGHFKRTPMNMFMQWVDIKTNKESMIRTLTLTIQDGGIIQISVMETKHKLLLHHLTIGHTGLPTKSATNATNPNFRYFS